VDSNLISLVGAGIALIAVALSTVSLFTGRRERRLDAFFRVQDFLLNPDAQEGRYLLYEADRRGALPKDREEFALIVRSLSNFNTVAVFARRGIVNRDWLLDVWHHSLAEMRLGFDSVVAYRRRNWHDRGAWPDLDQLIAAAAAYRCDLPCCSPPPLEAAAEGPVLLGGGPARPAA
jgi:hypothetical protein